MLSWKVWTTFVIVCISCVEYWHSNSCVSLTAVQLGLVVVGWSRSWSHEFNPDIKDLFLFRAYLFTSHTCWGLLFLLLANACLFSSLIWSRFDSLRLLNARLWDSLVFSIFSNLFACRALFCLFLNSLFLLLLVMYPSDELSLSVLWLTYLPLFHYCLWFYTDLSLTELVHCYELHCLPRNNPTTICKACAYFIFLNRILPSKHQATSCIQRFFFFCPMILSGSGECIGPFHFLF